MEDLKFLAPVELLEILRNEQKIKGLPFTDYRLAKILGMTQQGIMHTLYQNGTLSDENAIKLADELKLPRSYVVACMMRHRAKKPELKEMWENVAEMSMKNIAFLILGLALLYLPFIAPMQ